TNIDSLPRIVSVTPNTPRSPPIPYTTLFRSQYAPRTGPVHRKSNRAGRSKTPGHRHRNPCPDRFQPGGDQRNLRRHEDSTPALEDRKSTRLNSSHVSISYAVF